MVSGPAANPVKVQPSVSGERLAFVLPVHVPPGRLLLRVIALPTQTLVGPAMVPADKKESTVTKIVITSLDSELTTFTLNISEPI